MASDTEQSDYSLKVSHLLSYADTEKEKAVIRALGSEGSERKAAAAVGIPKSTVHDIVARVKLKASTKGYSPDHDLDHPVPDPFVVKGVSTYYDSDGKAAGQWVKSVSDAGKLKQVAKAAAEAFFKDRDPLPAISGPWTDPMIDPDSDLLSMYVLSDLHLGMYSWAKETGSDYDSDIAARLIVRAFEKLFSRSPDSEYCIIAQLGDLLHTDDDSNATKRSGHPLDVDTRYQRIAQVGLSVYRSIIDMALKKHQEVHVVNVPGNHDDITGYWLGVAIKTAYANEPRLSIDDSPGPYFYRRFGSNAFGFCHGHTVKPEALGEIMVADAPEMISSTEYRYWMTGHIHHTQVKENRICTVESFRTLASKDSWHHGKGYRSARDMKCIVFHRDYGEDERLTVSLKELEKDESP